MDFLIEMMEKMLYAQYMTKEMSVEKKSFSQYLTYSEEDENLGMVCTNVGYTGVKPNTVYPPDITSHPVVFRQVAKERTLPEFQLEYVTRGQGIFEAEGSSFNINAGTFFLVFPGMKHRYTPVYDIGWDEYWVGFKGRFFSELLQAGILSKEHIVVEIGLQNDIVSIFNQIFDEVRIQQPLYQFKACLLILSLVSEMIINKRRKKQVNMYQRIVENVKYLIESNIDKKINLSDISNQVGLSLPRLNEIFKTYTSMTPHQYSMHIKIIRAQSLLEHTEGSIKEVAFSVGLVDQYYFSRVFKKRTGIAPSKWKKSFCQ